MPAGAQIAALCGTAFLLVVLVILISRQIKGTPEKRERKRRLSVNMEGRLGDAFITEANDSVLYYSYSVAGVQYEASQDVTTLRYLLPPEPERLIGSASLKYTPRNPANSILICERWSGLRTPGPQAGSAAVPSPTLKDS
jgi:hypothetical protein